MRFSSNIKVRNIAGENVVIMQGQFGADLTRIVQLNNSSEWLLLELLDRDFEVSDIVDLLTSRYDVDAQTAEADAIKWVNTLRGYNLLVE